MSTGSRWTCNSKLKPLGIILSSLKLLLCRTFKFLSINYLLGVGEAI